MYDTQKKTKSSGRKSVKLLRVLQKYKYAVVKRSLFATKNRGLLTPCNYTIANVAKLSCKRGGSNILVEQSLLIFISPKISY